MKILLDENLPHELRRELSGHEVFTVRFMKWDGIRNGKLMQLAAEAGFGVMITNDRGMEFEHNLETLPIAVCVLQVKSNTMSAIRPLLGSLRSTLETIRPYKLVKIATS